MYVSMFACEVAEMCTASGVQRRSNAGALLASWKDVGTR